MSDILAREQEEETGTIGGVKGEGTQRDHRAYGTVDSQHLITLPRMLVKTHLFVAFIASP